MECSILRKIKKVFEIKENDKWRANREDCFGKEKWRLKKLKNIKKEDSRRFKNYWIYSEYNEDGIEILYERILIINILKVDFNIIDNEKIWLENWLILTYV